MPWASGFRLPASGLLILCAAACTPDFQSANVVQDLRVLAVQAEPPDARIDLQARTVDDVTVRVLFADPNHPGANASLTGSACFPTDEGTCPPGSVQLLGSSGPIGELSLQLAPSKLSPALRDQLVSTILAAQQDDRLKGLGGIRLQLDLQVTTPDPAGPQSARKLLLYSADDPCCDRNHQPGLAQLEVSRLGTPLATLHDGETLILPLGEELDVRPRLTDGSIETYRTVDLRGQTVQLTESPRYSFYTTPGVDLDRSESDEPLALGFPEPPRGLVRLTGQRRGSGTFWTVVRDGRGGEAWLRVPWSVQ